MADIKTRDAVKGTIKTLDKAAIAGRRMKSAYARQRTRRSRDIMQRKIPPRNMPPIRFPMLRGVSRTRASTNSISRGRKTPRLQGRISVRQRIKSPILRQSGRKSRRAENNAEQGRTKRHAYNGTGRLQDREPFPCFLLFPVQGRNAPDGGKLS